MQVHGKPWYKRLIHPELISLLFCSFILMGITSYFAQEQLWLYLPLSFVASIMMFALYHYTNKHKLKGGAICLTVIAFLVVLMYYFIGKGTDFYEASGDYYYIVWVLTPNRILDYNVYYVALNFLLFMLFITFSVYYFTRIQYRIFMSFLVMLFPFVVYGKDGDQPPLWVSVPLLLLYFFLMIYERQLLKPAPKHKFRLTLRSVQATQKPVWNTAIWNSVGFFISVSVLLAMALPKPKVNTNREYIENIMRTSSISDLLMSAISDFTESSNGGDPTQRFGDTQVVLYMNADDSVNLKSRTFTRYSFETDTWYVGKYDQKFFSGNWEEDLQWNDANLLMDAVALACQDDPEFAKTYHLTEYLNQPDTKLPEKKCVLIPQTYKIPFLLSPTSLTAASIGRYERTERTYTGTISLMEQYGQYPYNFSYQVPDIETAPRLGVLMNAMTFEEWCQFVPALYFKIPKSEKTLMQTVDEYNKTLWNTLQYLDDYEAAPSERIASLSRIITRDCKTQLEQVQALLNYFWNNGFVYDKDYRKGAGENAETFLFESKTGVCYQFATAMALMCRSIGIPARYTEGFSASERDGHRFAIRYRNSHAFVEVYLNGFGWTSVDPTISDESSARLGFQPGGLTEFIGLTLLVTFAFIIAFYLLLYQHICEMLFAAKIKRQSGRAAIAAMVKRLQRQSSLPDSLTLEETKELLLTRFDADAASLTSLCSAAVYGNEQPDAAQVREAYQTYDLVRKKITSVQRQNKKQQKKIKRGNQMEIHKTKH